MDDHGDSQLVGKEPCPSCGSRNNLARYSDGHAYCFGMGCGHYEPPEGSSTPRERRHDPVSAELIPDGEFKALPKRGITEETCRRYGYQVGKFKGKTVQIAPYRDDRGNLVAQKLRFSDKGEGMPWLGDGRKPCLFGQHLPVRSTRRLIVTEGEIDCMAVSQAGGNKWPVVSIPLGATGAADSFARSLAYLSQFDEVVICFDSDEPGQKAAEEAARVLPAGKASIARLPMKDAGEMVEAGRSDELISCVFSATPWKPQGVLTFKDIRADVLKPVEVGLPWAFPTLTKLTYGRRHGEIYALGAGTGIGKTDLLTQQIRYDITDLNQKVGLFFLEQQPQETGKRLAGKVAGKRFHIPPDPENPEWSQQDLEAAVEELGRNPNLYFYDSFGSTRWDDVAATMRYLAKAEGVRIFYLDHLTALAAAEESEKEGLEKITAEMGALVKELNVIIIMVSHLATPEGKPHEEGGRVMIRHFKGSRAIGFWCHYMFGLERDQQAEDIDIKTTTTFRVLKDRYTGNATGEVFYLGYNREEGILFERPAPAQPSSASDYGMGGDESAGF